jgi:hypothetical protein
MSGHHRIHFGALAIAALVAFAAASPATAQDAAWRVSKSSGEVWLSKPDVEKVALESDAMLKPGDTIRTGANGRVLLVRGMESILVSANTVIGIPETKVDEKRPTTILQQAGTILLDVERKKVQHFEVTTPYLAAVVKGTQFRVTVDDKASRVDVLSGQVQVSDHKTGQRALVNPDQSASVSIQGKSGLSLSGSGPLSPIELGTPRAAPMMPASMRIASNAAPAAERAPAANPPVSVTAPAPRRAERSQSDRDSDWAASAMAWGKSLFGFSGKKGPDDDNMSIIAIPVLIGLSATAGAVILRRRRKGSDTADDR